MLNRKLISFLVLLLLLAVLFLILLGFTIQFQSEGLLRAGIYRYVHGTIERGDIVQTCLPPRISTYAMMRHYISSGRCPGGTGTVTLQVVAKAPDIVQLTTDSVIINGEALAQSATQQQDQQKREIPAIPRGVYYLTGDQLWLMGHRLDSWDSRYFGSIDKIQVRSIIRPIITI